MKVIVLAAGQGTRLKPLTDDRPKCMVEFRGKPIIDYIADAVKDCGINSIVIVDGYRADVLENHLAGGGTTFVKNARFESTNMVATLFAAESELDDDIIISYADIVYKREVLRKLVECPADFSVVVDKNWRELWSMRMDNPLSDAETMKIDGDGRIYELGKKPSSYSEIEGQYIGLIKMSKEFAKKARLHYHSLDKNKTYDGKSFDMMYMTSFIQSIIDNVERPKAVFIEGGWIEVDSVEDLKIYENSALP
ncbi:MAG: phosphocholine cytidylyltransferase family protein [Spirochaetaceae bacterium]|jgi:choline kinase|nr:phosphocholine cytidylyltransferase family protein [Spirochaetaceae bacterium]